MKATSFQIQFRITSSRSAFAVCLTRYASSPRGVMVRQGTVLACGTARSGCQHFQEARRLWPAMSSIITWHIRSEMHSQIQRNDMAGVLFALAACGHLEEAAYAPTPPAPG